MSNPGDQALAVQLAGYLGLDVNTTPSWDAAPCAIAWDKVRGTVVPRP
jgi:hypothetical protein